MLFARALIAGPKLALPRLLGYCCYYCYYLTDPMGQSASYLTDPMGQSASYLTVMPMDRAVPAMILAAWSMSFALRSSFLVSAISRT